MLFVTEGPVAQMAPVEGQAGTYTFTMPIRTAKQPVIWFTDRPARDAGTLSMRNFVGLWSAKGTNTFATDPPNVAINYTSGGKQKTLIATMTSPVIIPPTATPGTAKLQATMTAVPEEQLATYAKGKGKLAKHAKKAQRNPSRFPASSVIVHTPSVFVDVYNAGGCNWYTNNNAYGINLNITITSPYIPCIISTNLWVMDYDELTYSNTCNQWSGTWNTRPTALNITITPLSTPCVDLNIWLRMPATVYIWNSQ
jgi:hypothetical protein